MLVTIFHFTKGEQEYIVLGDPEGGYTAEDFKIPGWTLVGEHDADIKDAYVLPMETELHRQ